MSGFGLPELIILGLEVLVIAGIVYGGYRLVRIAMRRELDRRETEPRHREHPPG